MPRFDGRWKDEANTVPPERVWTAGSLWDGADFRGRVMVAELWDNTKVVGIAMRTRDTIGGDTIDVILSNDPPGPDAEFCVPYRAIRSFRLVTDVTDYLPLPVNVWLKETDPPPQPEG